MHRTPGAWGLGTLRVRGLGGRGVGDGESEVAFGVGLGNFWAERLLVPVLTGSAGWAGWGSADSWVRFVSGCGSGKVGCW